MFAETETLPAIAVAAMFPAAVEVSAVFTLTAPPFISIGPAALIAKPTVTVAVFVVLPTRTLELSGAKVIAEVVIVCPNASPTDSSTFAPVPLSDTEVKVGF